MPLTVHDCLEINFDTWVITESDDGGTYIYPEDDFDAGVDEDKKEVERKSGWAYLWLSSGRGYLTENDWSSVYETQQEAFDEAYEQYGESDEQVNDWLEFGVRNGLDVSTLIDSEYDKAVIKKLVIKEGDWYEFDHNGTDTILPYEEYNADDYGHEDGQYNVAGAGGVVMSSYVEESEGFCWYWFDENQDNRWSGIHKTHQECFDEAFENLYVQCQENDREGGLVDWYAYASFHDLSTKDIDDYIRNK